jgi:hypothetical protein
LSAEKLQALTKAELIFHYPETYQQPIPQRKRVKIDTIPLIDIHKAILENKTNQSNASAQLGVSPPTLKAYLAKLCYKDKPLSFEIVSELTEEEILTVDCPKPHSKPITSTISRFTLQEIHQLVFAANNVKEAIKDKGLNYTMLQRNLNRLTYHGKPLTVKHLKTLPKETIRNAFPDIYEKLLAEVLCSLPPVENKMSGKKRAAEPKGIEAFETRKITSPYFSFFPPLDDKGGKQSDFDLSNTLFGELDTLSLF